MRRDGHDRARAVSGQDEVRHPDRHLLARERIDRVRPGEAAVLLRPFGLALDAVLSPDRLHPLLEGSSVGMPFEEARHGRVLGREDHRGRAVDGVGARREDLEPLAELRHLELEVGADGTADPVPLHRPDLLGPLPELVEAGEEAVGVLRDLQEPLLQLALLDGALAALARPALGLLVREDRLAGGAPVDRPLLPVGEPLLEHPEEEPLVPAVVLRLAGRDFLRPVVEDAPPGELLLHRGDVRERRLARRNAALDREVLRGEAEGVPPHRAEDLLALLPEVPVQRVRQEVGPRVADVEPVPRRVREHDEEVGPARRRVVRVDEGRLVGVPAGLPLLLEGGAFFSCVHKGRRV